MIPLLASWPTLKSGQWKATGRRRQGATQRNQHVMQCTRYQSVTQPFTGKISKVCFVTWSSEKKNGVSLKRKTRTFQPKRGACRLQPPTFLLTDGVKCYLVKRDPHHYLPLIHPFALFSCLLKTQSSFSKKKVQGPIALSLSRLRSTKIRPTRRRHQLMSDPSKQRLLKEDMGQSDAERARSPDKQKAQRRCHFNWPHFPPPEKKVPQN